MKILATILFFYIWIIDRIIRVLLPHVDLLSFHGWLLHERDNHFGTTRAIVFHILVTIYLLIF